MKGCGKARSAFRFRTFQNQEVNNNTREVKLSEVKLVQDAEAEERSDSEAEQGVGVGRQRGRGAQVGAALLRRAQGKRGQTCAGELFASLPSSP